MAVARPCLLLSELRRFMGGKEDEVCIKKAHWAYLRFSWDRFLALRPFGCE